MEVRGDDSFRIRSYRRAAEAIEGLPQQIADMLDISPNTAAGRYRYGMEKLRHCLKGKTYERLELSREQLAEMDSAPSFA